MATDLKYSKYGAYTLLSEKVAIIQFSRLPPIWNSKD
jgi:hypothetical protein